MLSRLIGITILSIVISVGGSEINSINSVEAEKAHNKENTSVIVTDSFITEKSDATIEGYILKIQDGKILVVNPTPKDYSSTGGAKEFYDAIWFSNPPKNLSVGQRVIFSSEFVAQSYPGQSKVKELEVIESPSPEGANMNEVQVIQNALALYDYKGMVIV